MKYNNFNKNCELSLDRDFIFEDLENTIIAYKDTFAGPPWFEKWTNEEVRKIISEAYFMDNFKGKVITDSKNILGFTLRYQIPNFDTQTVAFSQINNLLLERGWNDCFYLAECGVIQNFQRQGLGKLLISSLKEDISNLVFRTTNPNLIKTIESVYKQEVTTLFKDPIKQEREWCGVRSLK